MKDQGRENRLRGEFHGPRDYLDLATTAEAAEHDLRWLSASPYTFVVEAVARHPSTPADVLERLVPPDPASSHGQAVLLGLAENPGSTLRVFDFVAQQVPQLLHERDCQQGFAAGIALFRRADVPEEILLRLLDGARVTTEFRKVAARETIRKAVLARLADDRSERVRRVAVRRLAG